MTAAGCDLTPVVWARELKKIQRIQSQQTTPPERTGSHSFMSQASNMMKLGGDLWSQGVKKLVAPSGDLAITVITEALMSLKETAATSDYLYFDPRILKFSPTTALPKGRMPFEEAIVFMVGGGNYVEYQNLQDFCARAGLPRRRITYGSL